MAGGRRWSVALYQIKKEMQVLLEVLEQVEQVELHIHKVQGLIMDLVGGARRRWFRLCMYSNIKTK